MKIKKGLLRCNFTVENVTDDMLVEFLHKKGVSIFKYKKVRENTVKICIDYCDRHKFFAISKNMCYNIKKESYLGFLSPLVYACKNIGIFLGITAFLILSFYFDNLLLDIKCTGTGACFSSKIIETASLNGASKYSKFSKLNLKELESTILSSNSRLSFVTCKKSGNVLVIDSVLNIDEQDILQENIKDVTSTRSGIVESVEVLRGTALVEKGDTVNVGDVLIGAYMIGKNEEVYPTYVVGKVSIITQETFEYDFDSVSEELIKIAESTAKFNASGEVVSAKTEVNGNTVKVVVDVRIIIGN